VPHGHDLAAKEMSAGMSTDENKKSMLTRHTQRRAPEGLSSRQWSAVLVLLTVVAYAPAFTAGFIWDDDDYIQNNYNLRTASGLAKIWLEPRSSPQ
jgi:hypothetical protein